MVSMKFYERAAFKQLNAKWRKKLARSGFKDAEDKAENLRDHNRRTQLFDDRELVLSFFLSLDEFLNQANIPRKHRRVLELYSAGTYVTEISARVNMSYAWTRSIISLYERKVLAKE